MPSKKALETKDGAVFTASNGAAVAEPYAAHRIGVNGPLLIQGEAAPQILSSFSAYASSQTSTSSTPSRISVESVSQSVSYVMRFRHQI